MSKNSSRRQPSAARDLAVELAGGAANGGLWIGQHAGDKDILVLDPNVSDPAADVLTLYSLRQHRTRRFPRATVLERIHVVTQEVTREQARTEYAQRAELKEHHQQNSDSARAERMDRIREGMIAAHKRFVESLEMEYRGVRATGTELRSGRIPTKCAVCALPLDDFVGVTCASCSGVLCSCGGCMCGKPVRGRRAAAAVQEAANAVQEAANAS